MNLFRNSKIQTKLIVSFSILVFSIFCGFGLCIRGIQMMNTATEDISINWLPSSLNAGEVKSHINECRHTMLLHILTSDINSKKEIDRNIHAIRDEIREHLSEMKKLTTSEAASKVISEIPHRLEEYIVENDRVLELSRQNKSSEARELIEGRSKKIFEQLVHDVQSVIDLNQIGTDASVASSTKVSSNSFRIAIGAMCLASLIGCGAYYLLVRAISRPLQQLAQSATAMANGDLTNQVQVLAKDEVGTVSQSIQDVAHILNHLMKELHDLVSAARSGNLSVRSDASKFKGVFAELVMGMNETLSAVQKPIDEAVLVLGHVANRTLTTRMNGSYAGSFESMQSSLNAAIDGLNESLSQVAVGAEQVNSAASQIANGSQSLAHGASQQASALADITISMDQMNSSTKLNADNAAMGRTLAEQSQASVNRGSEAMIRMGTSIAKIKESSDATAKIVKTIDDIAFQTNLLALNAAVEAARAGDAGKGFAVVAEEVRNLAQRSAAAAKSTAELIEESVKNSEGGVTITAQMSNILSEISEGSRKVNDLIAEIAAASQEQSQGINQVNSALTNLDKLTQETAANSEQSASAGEELSAQASSLANTVSEFKLTTSHNTPRISHAQPSMDLGSPVAPESFGNIPTSTSFRRTKSPAPQSSKPTAKKVLVPLDDDDFSGF